MSANVEGVTDYENKNIINTSNICTSNKSTSVHVDIYDKYENNNNDENNKTQSKHSIHKKHSMENKSPIQKTITDVINENVELDTNTKTKHINKLKCLNKQEEYYYYCPICKQEQLAKLCPGDVCSWCHIARWASLPFTTANCVCVIMLLLIWCVSFKPFFSDVYFGFMLAIGYGGYVFGGLYVYYWIHKKATTTTSQVELCPIDFELNCSLCEQDNSHLCNVNKEVVSYPHNAVFTNSQKVNHTQFENEILLLKNAHYAMSQTYYVKLAIKLRGRSVHSVFPTLQSEVQRIHNEYSSNSSYINNNVKKSNKRTTVLSKAFNNGVNIDYCSTNEDNKVKNDINEEKEKKKKINEMRLITQSPSSLSLQRTCDTSIKSHYAKINIVTTIKPAAKYSTREEMEAVSVIHSEDNDKINNAEMIESENNYSSSEKSSDDESTNVNLINNVSENKGENIQIDVIDHALEKKEEKEEDNIDDKSNNVEENHSSVEINTQGTKNTVNESTKLCHVLSANSINHMVHTNLSSSSSSLSSSITNSFKRSSLPNHSYLSSSSSESEPSSSCYEELSPSLENADNHNNNNNRESTSLEERNCNNEENESKIEYDELHIERKADLSTNYLNKNATEMTNFKSHNKYGKRYPQSKIQQENEEVEKELDAPIAFIHRKMRETISLLQIGTTKTSIATTNNINDVYTFNNEKKLPHSFQVALQNILPTHKYQQYIINDNESEE